MNHATKSNEWDTLVQVKHLTESRQMVRDGRCSSPTSPTSFTLNPVGADVRSTLSEQLLVDSREWLCAKSQQHRVVPRKIPSL